MQGLESEGPKNWIPKNWIPKNWIFINEFIVESRYSLMNLDIHWWISIFIDESWIHWWISIFIVGHPIFIVGHPAILFCPRSPKSDFSWKIQKDARRKMIEIRLFKKKMEPCDAIWCQFGSQISSPKTRVYEYNQLIFSMLTVFFFDFPGAWTTS